MTSKADDFAFTKGIPQRQRIGLVFYLTLCLIIVLQAGLSGWSVYRDYQASTREVRRNITALSRSLEGYISALLQQSYESIRMLALDLGDPHLRPGNDSVVASHLAAAMRYDPVSSYLFVFRDGRLLAVDTLGRPAEAQLTALIPQLVRRVGEKPLFGEPLPAGDSYLMPLLIGREDGLGGEVIFGALINTDRIGQLLERLGLEEHMNAGMVDEGGRVLYRTPQTHEFVGKPLPADSPIRPLLGQDLPAIVQGVSIDEQNTLFAVAPSRNFPALAVVGETVASYQMPWLKRSFYNLVVLVLSLLVTVLVAWQLRRLIGQISRNGQFYRQVFTDINDGILLLAEDGTVQTANRRAAELFGVESSSWLQQRTPWSLSPVQQPDGRHSEEFVRDVLARLLAGERQERSGEWRFLRCDNAQPFDCEVRVAQFRWRQRSMVLMVLNDITQRKRYIAEQEYFANHDSLTGLPNRYWLMRHISQRIAMAPHERFAVLLLDMNRFKEVNDTLGHHHGDQVLQDVGGRLARWLKFRNAQIARLGGDEMAIVTSGLPDEYVIGGLCQGICQILNHPISVEGIQLELSASIGVAHFPENGDNPDDLLRCADIAMYQAKNSRRNFLLYHPGLDHYTPERLALHSRLGRAIREGDLQLHYQPKVRLADRELVGFEALLRWEHAELGLISPADFIPLAESTELIHPLTHWVLDHAMRQWRSWEDGGLSTRIAINISANNLRNPHFAGELQTLLERYRVPPGVIELEVTEGTLLDDPELALRSLQAIRNLGVLLSIDDFGTGYSSLAYLKRLPVQVLKIDRTFVSAMSSSPSDAMIVQSTVDLGHNFGMLVVAEGVEDAATAAELLRLGCDIGQGYLFGRPMPAEQVMAWRLQRQMENLGIH